jgi:hypothetical protein
LTTNSTRSTISNYDYISKAVIKYNRSKLKGMVSVDLNSVPIHKGYSKFQGDGNALVLSVIENLK